MTARRSGSRRRSPGQHGRYGVRPPPGVEDWHHTQQHAFHRLDGAHWWDACEPEEAQAVDPGCKASVRSSRGRLPMYTGWPTPGPSEDKSLLKMRTARYNCHVDWVKWTRETKDKVPSFTAWEGRRKAARASCPSSTWCTNYGYIGTDGRIHWPEEPPIGNSRRFVSVAWRSERPRAAADALAEEQAQAFAMGQQARARAASSDAVSSRQRANRLFNELDANQDGMLSREEFDGARFAARPVFDDSGNDRLKSTSISAAETRIPATFPGAVSTQSSAAFAASAAAAFDRLDKNQDGVIDRSEFAAGLQPNAPPNLFPTSSLTEPELLRASTAWAAGVSPSSALQAAGLGLDNQSLLDAERSYALLHAAYMAGVQAQIHASNLPAFQTFTARQQESAEQRIAAETAAVQPAESLDAPCCATSSTAGLLAAPSLVNKSLDEAAFLVRMRLDKLLKKTSDASATLRNQEMFGLAPCVVSPRAAAASLESSAPSVTAAEREIAASLFDHLDTNRDGTLTREEFTAVLPYIRAGMEKQ